LKRFEGNDLDDRLIAALDASKRIEGIDVLTSCDLISEGLDVPSVGAVIHPATQLGSVR
jgi:superfamily II DNA or RNA helicase